MLSLPEEFLLLMLKDEGGAFVPASYEELGTGLAGAALMDLGIQNRLDSDKDKIWVTDTRPTGHSDLNLVLDTLVQKPGDQGAMSTISAIGAIVPQIRERALKSLVSRGIIQEKEGKVLWIFPMRRYPVLDGKEIRDIKLRLLEVLFDGGLPNARDVCILSIVDLVGVLSHIVPPSELGRAGKRIASIAQLDLIGVQLREHVERERERLYAAIAAQAGMH